MGKLSSFLPFFFLCRFSEKLLYFIVLPKPFKNLSNFIRTFLFFSFLFYDFSFSSFSFHKPNNQKRCHYPHSFCTYIYFFLTLSSSIIFLCISFEFNLYTLINNVNFSTHRIKLHYINFPSIHKQSSNFFYFLFQSRKMEKERGIV